MKFIRILLFASLILTSLPVTSVQAAPVSSPLLADTATPSGGPELLAPAQDSTPDVIRPVFDWGDVTGASAYIIDISNYSNFAILLIETTVTASTFTPTADLTRNVPVYWRVRVATPVAGPWSTASFISPNPPYSPSPLTPGLGATVTTLLPTLTWAASPTPLPAGTTFAYYQLQVDDDADFSSLLLDSNVPGLSFTFAQPLTAETTYSWRIRTANTLGQVSMWRTSSFVTSLPAPTLLSPAPQEVVSSLRPALDWSDVPGANGYGVELSYHSDFSSPFVSLALSDSAYVPTANLPLGTLIFWRVRTHGIDVSDWSSSSFTTPATVSTVTSTAVPATSTDTPIVTSTGTLATVTPSSTQSTASPTTIISATPSFTPTGPSPTPTSTRGTITITVTGSHTPTPTWTKTVTVTPTNTKTLTITLTPSITKTPTITLTPTISLTPSLTRTPTITLTPSVTKTPTITFTPSLTRTPTLTRTPIPLPTLLAPEPGSTPEIIRPIFDWSDVPGATVYNITVSRYSNFAFPSVNTNTRVSTFTPAADLPRSVPLYWRVRVVAPFVSGWVSSSFQAPNPPFSPPPLSPGLNALVTDYTPMLLWGSSVLPAGTTFAFYQLQVDDQSDFSSPFVGVSEPDVLNSSYTFLTDLASNSTYYWRVRTANTDNQYSMWRTSYFRTALLPPVLVSPALSAVPDSLRPVFSWQAVAGATGYGLVVSTRADFLSPRISVAVKTLSFSPLADLPRNTLIYWRVRAQGTNISAWSSSSFTLPNPPNALVLVSPLPQGIVGLNPTLTWNPAVLPLGSTFAYYQLELSLNNNPTTPIFSTTLTDITQHSYTFTDQSVVNAGNGQYYWHVRAANTDNQFSTWSSRPFLLRIAPTRTPTRTPTPSRTPTPTRTLTPTPAGLGRLYQSDQYGYKFNYPNDATLNIDTGSHVQIHFTIMPGTNLGEKYVDINIWDPTQLPCIGTAPAHPSPTGLAVVINGVSFWRENGSDAGAGNIYDWVSYSAAKDHVCVNMQFFLHSTNPGNYFPTPPPLFDKLGESQVFTQILNTFTWIPITIAATPSPTVTPTTLPSATPTWTPTATP